MQAREIIKAIVADGNMPMTHISRAMGRSHLFISRYTTRSIPPGVELLAEVCDATNHELIVRNKETGREIVIDPPERSDDGDSGTIDGA